MPRSTECEAYRAVEQQDCTPLATEVAVLVVSQNYAEVASDLDASAGIEQH